MDARDVVTQRHTIAIPVDEIIEEFDLPEDVIVKGVRLAIGTPSVIVIEFDEVDYQIIEHKTWPPIKRVTGDVDTEYKVPE